MEHADHDGRRVRLRADASRPIPGEKYLIILSDGSYAKRLAFQDGYTNQWQLMTAQPADVAAGSSNKYQKTILIGPLACVVTAGADICRSLRYLTEPESV